MDPLERYRRYLLTFGIAEPGEWLAEPRGREPGGLRAFAYTGGGGGQRYRAIATPHGLLRPGWHPEDDWFGFLSLAGAAAAAELIAWLASDGGIPPGGLPTAPWQPLSPGPPPPGIDPALWRLVGAPRIAESPGGLHFQAFFLPGAQEPCRLTVLARPDGPARIELEAAGDLLAAAAGGREEAAAEAGVRALRLLEAGGAGEKEWALRHLAAGGRAALPAVAALLLSPAEPAPLRLRAASLLAELGGPPEFEALAKALRADSDAAVRRAAAQALGRLSGERLTAERAAGALAAAWRQEPDPLVRAEIVHALAATGGPAAHAALAAIAGGDSDKAVAELAAFYSETYEERGPSS